MITPNRTGEFSLVCTELCGLGHATMRSGVRVADRAQYEKFISVRQPRAGSGDVGKVLTTAGCGACHAFEPAGTDAEVGPNLNQIDPGGEPLEDFVRESIVDPNAKIARDISRA